MARINLSENGDLEKAFFSCKKPDLRKIRAEVRGGKDVSLEYRFIGPSPDLFDTRAEVIVRITAGRYSFSGHKRFGYRNGDTVDALLSIKLAEVYVTSLKETLEFLSGRKDNEAT